MMTYKEVCHREYCKTFSKLVMGTDHLGTLGDDGSRDDKKAIEMLNLALRYGINAFDTAPIYIHGIEQLLGEWMRGKRADNPNIVLHTITKGGFPFDIGVGRYESRLEHNKEDIIRNIQGELKHSLSNLNHQIDVYLMHRDDVDYEEFKLRKDEPTTRVEDILEALSDQRFRNSYTWIGVSNWKDERVKDALRASREAEEKLLQPVISSPYFSLFEMDN